MTMIMENDSVETLHVLSSDSYSDQRSSWAWVFHDIDMVDEPSPNSIASFLRGSRDGSLTLDRTLLSEDPLRNDIETPHNAHDSYIAAANARKQILAGATATTALKQDENVAARLNKRHCSDENLLRRDHKEAPIEVEATPVMKTVEEHHDNHEKDLCGSSCEADDDDDDDDDDDAAAAGRRLQEETIHTTPNPYKTEEEDNEDENAPNGLLSRLYARWTVTTTTMKQHDSNSKKRRAQRRLSLE